MSRATSLFIPSAGVRAVAEEIQVFGQQNLETGGFLAMRRGQATVSTVAMAGTSGIGRAHNLLQISARALDRLFAYADEQDLWIPIQFHSHAASAFLSQTDRTLGLCVEGFVSTVVPNFHRPPANTTAWGWWRYSGGEWLDIEAAGEVPGEVGVIRFDEDGVRAS